MDLLSLVSFVASCIAIFMAVCSIWWGVRNNTKTTLEITVLRNTIEKVTSRITLPTDKEVKEIEKRRIKDELARARREDNFKLLMEQMDNEKSRKIFKALYDLMQRPDVIHFLDDLIRGRPKDFRNQNISGEYFFGLDLRESDFQNAITEKADFRRANLSQANFHGANLLNADFSHAHLIYADFRCANLRNADFSGANVAYAQFTGADVTDANFEGADVNNSDFRGAYGIDVHKLALASWSLYLLPKLDPELDVIARARYPEKYKKIEK
jgi:uncharacterized protein YjbI with pentapeptide repeats